MAEEIKKRKMTVSASQIEEAVSQIDNLVIKVNANALKINSNATDILTLQSDIEKLTDDLFNVPGNTIASNTDLNDIMTPGAYICKSSTASETLLNCPMVAGFRLDVISLAAGTTRLMQVFYPNATGITIMYIRRYTASGWGKWLLVKDSETMQTSIDTNSADIKTLKNGVFDVPETLITSGTDLDTLTTAGAYMCQNSSVGSTLANCPVSAGFRLEVKYLATARDRAIQLLYHNLNDGALFYGRKLLSTGWTAWFAVGTPVSATATASEEG